MYLKALNSYSTF